MKYKKFIFILLLSFFFFPKSVFANVSSANIGLVGVNLSSATSSYTWYPNGSGLWANWGQGTLSASGTLVNVGTGTNTSSIMLLKSVVAYSSNEEFVCNIGSYSLNNSTFLGQSFSVTCPMKMNSGGLQKILFNFSTNNDLETLYRLNVTGVVTYAQDIVRIDSDTIVSAINGNSQSIVNSQSGTSTAINNNTTAVNNVKNSVDQTNQNIMNDDVTASTNTASGFFDDFSQNAHGLSGVLTTPLRLLNSLVTGQCSPLTFTLPFDDHEVQLKCMRPIYENYFGVFFTLFQLITTGMISYHVLINFYKKVRDLQNPKNDRIEVLNL